jgi:zinc protease
LALFVGGALGEDAPAEAALAFLDFSSGSPQGSMTFEGHALGQDPGDKGHVILFKNGESRLVCRFRLEAVPASAWLELEHLSSGAAGAPAGGSSPVSITVNGLVACGALDPGSHGYVKDRLAIIKFLKDGENVLEVRLGDAVTGYWLRRVAILGPTPAPGSQPPAPKALPRRIPGKGAFAYVVCLSHETYADPAWKAVADALVQKHRGALVLYPSGDPASATALLAEVHPRWTAFVARPEEASRRFGIALHRLTRRLDKDPYTDCLWGIVTGYEAADALRVAKTEGGLEVKRVLSGYGGMNAEDFPFREGMAYSECEQGAACERKPGQPAAKRACPPDATGEIVDLLNCGGPEAVFTSGHASERDWQIGYSFRAGQLRCREGRLLGIDATGKEYPVQSPNPKVYLACGNCLAGHIPDRDAMALAWIRSAGVRQLVGYTVSTWHGCVGWGVKDYWVGSQGRLTLAEAFFAAVQADIFELGRRFPQTAALDMDAFGIEGDPGLLGRFAAAHGISEKDNLGLLWDRDTVAFYGDPAWEARVAPTVPPAYEVSLRKEKAPQGRCRFTLELKATKDGEISRPVFARLPGPVTLAAFPDGAVAVAPGDFVLWRVEGALKKGGRRILSFTAEEVLAQAVPGG